jgi:hypothetical protein
MRSRNIKSGFFRNEGLAALTPLTRILFEGLWCLADRRGRLEDRPARIKADILPYDKCDVNKMLQSLQDSPENFIIRYSVEGVAYIQIRTFEEHQNPHIKEPESVIPPFQALVQEAEIVSTGNSDASTGKSGACTGNSGASMGNSGTSPADSLSLDSLSLNIKPSCRKSKDFDVDSIEMRLSKLLLQKIKTNNPGYKEPDLQSWACHIDLMIRKDNRKPDDIEKVIIFAQSDSFWISNILSTAKLREKYDQLTMRMNAPKIKPQKAGQAGNFEQRDLDADMFENCYKNPRGDK